MEFQMLPSKHEDLSKTNLMVGAAILQKLNRKSYVIEDLYLSMNDKFGLSLSGFFDVLMFLWLGNFLEVNDYEVRSVKGEYVS